MNRRTLILAGTTAAVALAMARLFGGDAADAGAVTIDAIGDQVQTLPRGQWPQFAGTGEIQRLYRYALERGDDLRYIPCFCGCGRFGHKNNQDCYIKSFNRDRTVTFTSHAAT